MSADEVGPDPAIAVSPSDQSSDREQSDANNQTAVDTAAQASTERAYNQATTSAHLDELSVASAERGAEQTITKEKLDILIDASHKVIEVNGALAMSTQAQADAINNQATAMTEYQERARLARRRFLVTIAALSGVAAILLGGLIAVIVINLTALHRIENDSTNIIDGRNVSRQLLTQISDCLTPSTDPKTCYAENQQRSEDFIGRLLDANLNIAACAPEAGLLPSTATPDQRKAAVSKCVTELSAK